MPASVTPSAGARARVAPAASASLFPGYTVCNGVMAFGAAAVALNADGTLNDCSNPAVAGSVVTLFLDGLGPVAPAQATGAIVPAPPVALAPGVTALDSNLNPIVSTTLSLPGSITGVAQMQLQLPKTLAPGPYLVTPDLG